MIKPAPPDAKDAKDVERYRREMEAFYATPERYGWFQSMGPRPQPEKVDGKDCYREHGVLKELATGKPVEKPKSK